MSGVAITTFAPSTRPCVRHSVYRSNKACVGCSQSPHPPLMTGDSAYLAPSRASSSLGWRSTSTLAYLETVRIMSARLSSLAAEDDTIGLASVTTAPPQAVHGRLEAHPGARARL